MSVWENNSNEKAREKTQAQRRSPELNPQNEEAQQASRPRSKLTT